MTHMAFKELRKKYPSNASEWKPAPGVVWYPPNDYKLELMWGTASAVVTVVEYIDANTIRVFDCTNFIFICATKEQRDRLAFAEVKVDDEYTDWNVYKLIEA